MRFSIRGVLLSTVLLLALPAQRHTALAQGGVRAPVGAGTAPQWGGGTGGGAERDRATGSAPGAEGDGGAGGGRRAKLVALVPVRDEAHLVESCLRALAGLVHATVVLDDCSTDGSGDRARALAVKYKVERVARSPNCPVDRPSEALPYWGSEAAHRGYLLEVGRSVGGTHFLAIDADEAIVAEGGGGDAMRQLRESMIEMKPGDLFAMEYRTMYGSMDTFRSDKIDMKAVAFADQEGAAFLRSAKDDRLHTPRIPHFPRPGEAWELKTAEEGHPPQVAVLHFGFSHLANARMKNVIYNFFDVVTGTAKTREEMDAGLDAQGITSASERKISRDFVVASPPEWRKCLGHAFDASVLASSPVAPWREAQALAWLAQDPVRFAGLAALQVLGEHAGLESLPAAARPRARAMLSRLARAREPRR